MYQICHQNWILTVKILNNISQKQFTAVRKIQIFCSHIQIKIL